MIWTCAEEGEQLYWQKDSHNGTTKQEAKRVTKDEIYGYGERGNADV